MAETKISSDIYKMIKKEFKDVVKITRHHCGIAKGFNGGFVNLGEKYWPDYIGFAVDGKFVGIEVKDPSGKTEKNRLNGQDFLRQKICSCGGYCIQTTGVDDCRRKLLKIKLTINQDCGIMKKLIFEKECKK